MRSITNLFLVALLLDTIFASILRVLTCRSLLLWILVGHFGRISFVLTIVGSRLVFILLCFVTSFFSFINALCTLFFITCFFMCILCIRFNRILVTLAIWQLWIFDFVGVLGVRVIRVPFGGEFVFSLCRFSFVQAILLFLFFRCRIVTVDIVIFLVFVRLSIFVTVSVLTVGPRWRFVVRFNVINSLLFAHYIRIFTINYFLPIHFQGIRVHKLVGQVAGTVLACI